MGQLPNMLYLASIWVIPVVIAVTFHEAAHGFVARFLGDDTAWKLGRVSLNPIRHIDPVGTILLPSLLLLLGSPFLFGYAKPVPVNFRALRNPRSGMVWACLCSHVLGITKVNKGIFWTYIFVTSLSECRPGGVPPCPLPPPGVGLGITNSSRCRGAQSSSPLHPERLRSRTPTFDAQRSAGSHRHTWRYTQAPNRPLKRLPCRQPELAWVRRR
jgi:hypothetical protein